MTQIEIVKAFLQDPQIQQKYSLTPDDVNRMTLQSQPNAEAKILVDLIKRMVQDVEDKSITINVAAATMNRTLENALR